MKSEADKGSTPAGVCVTGASSQLGVFLLPRLSAAGFRVVAVSRRAPRQPVAVRDNVIWLHPGALFPEHQTHHSAGTFVHLVSCGPLELARDIASRHAGLERIVAFSSSSVLSKAESPDLRENQLVASMAEQERDLADACAVRNLPLLLLRPTLIYGCGRDRNVSRLAGMARRFGVIPLAAAADGKRQPVHAGDLADLAVKALTADHPVAMTSEVCGGSTLTFRAMAESVARAVPRKVRLVALPVGVMTAMVRFVSMLPGWRGLNAEMVRRQSHDLVFDDSGLRRALNWAPRPFQPTAADFEVPEYARPFQLPDIP